MPFLKVIRMKRLVLAIGSLGLLATSALAQPVTSIVEGGGVKVGEGTVVHPVLGVETGVVHNVFFEDTDPETAGLLRIIGELALGSLPPERMQASEEEEDDLKNYGDLAFRAELSAQYEEYLSSNDKIQAQRDLQLAALARGIVNPRNALQFAFSDEFRRVARPVNFESSGNVDRDINRLVLEVRYRPRGRTLWGSFGYSNAIDYFEDDDQQFANRMQHTLFVNGSWQWLPVTRIYAGSSLGIFRPLGEDSTRTPSLPLRVFAGIATALTVKTSVNARVGFAKGFYESGPDFTSVEALLQFAYRFSPRSTFGVLYEHVYNDSINANYYRDHAVKLRVDHAVDRFAFAASGDFRIRRYSGVLAEAMATETERDDLIFQGSLGAIYNFQNWIAATADYNLLTDQTDFVYMPDPTAPPDDPSYTRHVFMVGVRAAY